MKIFILNRGSSSIKCHLHDLEKEEVLLFEATIEWENSLEKSTLRMGTHKKETSFTSTKQALDKIVEGAKEVLSSIDEIDAIGHRIAHGGSFFSESILITDAVKKKIKSLDPLAPFHNVPELEGIEILQKIFPKKPHIACFDTAFHHTLPISAQVYPIPYSFYKEGIKRYGFHGISYQYCSKKAAELTSLPCEKQVICHIGSGASLCAVKKGISIDTTMGLTPLEGLMMGSRCGSIGPGVLLHLLKIKKMSVQDLSDILYKESGLLGVSGSSSDMRDILKSIEDSDKRAILAFDVYIHRLSSSIGSMAVSLEGMDTLVFTAGVGENSPLLRELVCSKLSFLGVKLDKEKNRIQVAKDRDLSADDSKVKILLIHTQEALEMARECVKIISPS
jgi:acetate kinase